VGNLWFDTLELTGMILLPSEPLEPEEDYAPEALARWSPIRGWMSLRPVANWQFAVFLMLAKIVPRGVQISSPLLPFDMKRILRGSELDPVTRLTCLEAALYARWLGKGLCGQSDWQMASRLLPREAMNVLWGPLRREWAGSYDEGVCAVVTPNNYDQDWAEVEDDASGLPSEHRTFFDELETPEGVGFRTRVLSQFGLLHTPGSESTAMFDADLLEVLQRQ
jgi:formylglycine-generating enzyme required for sulfatase activity